MIEKIEPKTENKKIVRHKTNNRIYCSKIHSLSLEMLLNKKITRILQKIFDNFKFSETSTLDSILIRINRDNIDCFGRYQSNHNDISVDANNTIFNRK